MTRTTPPAATLAVAAALLAAPAAWAQTTTRNTATPPAPTSANAPAERGQRFPGYLDFGGRFLAVLSDADMVASAYMDGDLGPRSPGLRDELALVPLGGGPEAMVPMRVPVSNAVTAWPSNLAVSPDGRFAFVTEVDQPPPPGATRREDLRPGRRVTVVDLRDPAAPRVAQTLDVPRGRTHAATLTPDGRTLAVSVADAPGVGVYLYAVGEDGRLGEPVAADLPGTDAFARHVEFSPDGRFLAATFPAQHEARFYRVSRGADGRASGFEAWGEPMVTGKFAGVGHWTPDGRHFLVTNLYWFGGAADLYVGAQASTITSVAFDGAGDAAGRVRHTVVGMAPVGASAEEFAISPDGRRVVSLNMENSFLAPGDERLTFHSSLTLLDFNPTTGALTPLHTLPYEGILPEGITFDATGGYLAVATFAHANPRRPLEETTVDFFRLVEGPRPMLVQTDVRVPVMRGAHIVKLVR